MLPISVIVVARNAERTLTQCLEAIVRNCPAEIIVIDGNSDDRTLELAKIFTSKIFTDNGNGVSMAHQIGLEVATQEYISFIDSDIIITNDALPVMYDELRQKGLSNIQATRLAADKKTYWERAHAHHLKLWEHQNKSGISACVMDRKMALCVGFDSKINIAGDDYDFLLRLRKRGFKTGTSSALVFHHHRSNFLDFARQRIWYGRGKAQLIKKYGFTKLDLWPLVSDTYQVIQCVRKAQISFIPYFIVDCVLQSAGIIKDILKIKPR